MIYLVLEKEYHIVMVIVQEARMCQWKNLDTMGIKEKGIAKSETSEYNYNTQLLHL